MAQLGSAEDSQAVSFKEDYTVSSRVLVEGGEGKDDSGVLEVKSKGQEKRRFDGLITSASSGPISRDLC